MNFLQSDVFKKIAAAIAIVNGALLTSGVLPPVAVTVCTLLASIFGALGIVSGGTVGAQPKALVK